MRILTVIHTHWSRRLGGPRVQLELSEELKKLGHTIEKFSYEDAFPYKQSEFERLTCNFSLKAKAFVQKNAHRFDIIEAHQTDLPFSKEELGFKGLLVARSVGLIPMYKDALDALEAASSKNLTLRGVAGNAKKAVRGLIGYQSLRRRHDDVLPSLQACDLINVCNIDELAYVRDVMGLGHKCVCFPFGLPQPRHKDFIQAIQPAKLRLAKKEVAFIGAWSLRKGAKDWGEIIRRIRTHIPDVHFLFLGTGASRKIAFRDLNLPDYDWIKIIPSFESEELPKLLGEAMVGAFPSYIEGFPHAVLEKLACGLPTVAYDVPGPRETLRYLNSNWLVPAGDVEQFSAQVVKLLTLNEQEYLNVSGDCLKLASKFSWSQIATQTIDTYSEWLERIRASN